MQQIVRTFKDLREGLFLGLLGKIILGILRAVEEGKANDSELVLRRVLFCLTVLDVCGVNSQTNV
jgi:hypothetical protein